MCVRVFGCNRTTAADTEITARRLILAGGVVGTLRLLFANRNRHRSLPNESTMLGENVFTNSEAVTAVLHPKGDDISEGTGISSDFFPDENTHATQNRFDHGWQFMRPYFGPLVDDPRPWRRALRTLAASVLQLSLLVTNWFAREWEKRLTVFTVMQDLDNRLRFEYRRRWWWPFAPKMGTAGVPGHEAPTYLPVANEIARRYAEHAGGRPMNLLTETLGNLSTTAHILGGCPMGETAREGVIDANHEIHGHPGLFVVDGAAIPGNIGVNPSLTITALAERFADRQPAAE